MSNDQQPPPGPNEWQQPSGYPQGPPQQWQQQPGGYPQGPPQQWQQQPGGYPQGPPQQQPGGYPPGPPQQQWQQPRLSKKDARAQRAAIKAQRNWFARHKVLSALGALIVLIVVISIAASAGGSKKTPSANSGNTGATTAPNSTAGAKKTATAPDPGGRSLPIQNGDWKLVSVRPKNDGIGDFEVETRVTYTGSDSNGGTNVFTLTVFKNGKEIASLLGSANSVSPGSTASVDFLGNDKFVAGPYTYDFQNNI